MPFPKIPAHRRRFLGILGCCMAVMLAVTTTRELRLQGAASDGESVQIGITITTASASSAAASSVSSAAASSVSSAAASSTVSSETTTGGGGGGGRRGSVDRADWRVTELFRRWSGHPAAPSIHPADCRERGEYIDVPADAWFTSAIHTLLRKEFLIIPDSCRFRPEDSATRAEIARLLVEGHGGIAVLPLFMNSFIDSRPADWHYGYLEEAARKGWMIGDNNCYGQMQCAVRPNDRISRAEAVAVIVRALQLTPLDLAPSFPDVPTYSWYKDVIQIAADHCILTGDDRTHRVRPADPVSRAEFVVMFHRAENALRYGRDCGRPVTRSQMPLEHRRTTAQQGPNLCREYAILTEQLRITRPASRLSRGDMLLLLVEAGGGIQGLPISGPTFADIPPDHRLFGYVEEAMYYHWITLDTCSPGTTCRLQPEEAVTMAEAIRTLRSVTANTEALAGYATGSAAHAIVTRGEFVQMLLDARQVQSDSACTTVLGSSTQWNVSLPPPPEPRAGEMCQAPSIGCLAEAVRDDVRIAALSASTALFLPTTASFSTVLTGEIAIWIAVLLAGSAIAIWMERTIWRCTHRKSLAEAQKEVL